MVDLTWFVDRKLEDLPNTFRQPFHQAEESVLRATLKVEFASVNLIQVVIHTILLVPFARCHTILTRLLAACIAQATLEQLEQTTTSQHK